MGDMIMKICITAQADNLDSKVESRFGRSPYFIIYDTETSEFDAIENPNISTTIGVGIKSGQLVADYNLGAQKYYSQYSSVEELFNLRVLNKYNSTNINNFTAVEANIEGFTTSPAVVAFTPVAVVTFTPVAVVAFTRWLDQLR